MLTAVEAAALLGVTRRQVIKLIKQGKLRAEWFGNAWMVERASVEEYAATARQVGYPKGRPRGKEGKTLLDAVNDAGLLEE
jgi:excisionase family DNA binding protein